MQSALLRIGACCSGGRGRVNRLLELPLGTQNGMLGQSSTSLASASSATVLRPRGFATEAINVRSSSGKKNDQTLFIVGLNSGKFFGQDGAEEGLKLLERVAEHHPDYHLLFGLNEKEFALLESEHQVKGGRLTPSRDLATVKDGEVVPIMQAGVVDKRPRHALGRSLKTTQGHVAWRLWRNPREAIRLYTLFWKRNQHKDTARFKFWSENMPLASHVYFGESSELIAVRTTEHIIAERRKGKPGSTVLTVKNEVFASVVERCRHYLSEEEQVAQLDDHKFSEGLKEKAMALCKDVPEMTPLLVLIYIGFPLLAIHQVMLFCEYIYVKGSEEGSGSDFEFVTGNRD